jgi:fructose-specific phosphotransferase system IIC component
VTEKTKGGIPKFWKNWGQYFGTGASYMIPVILIGGFGTGLGQLLGASPADPEAGSELARFLYGIGNVGMTFFVPVLAAYLAFAIADRIAIAPGLVTGYFAVQLGTGFLGALIAGFLVGYLALLFIRKIKPPPWLITVWHFLTPFIIVLIVGAAFQWIIGPPIAAASQALTDWLTSLSAGGATAIVLGLIIGGMTGIDAGGPINKVAFFFALGTLGQGVLEPMAMFMAAAPVPSIGLGVAALVGGKLFSKDEREYAGGSLILGTLVGFSEGALPYIVKDIIRVAAAAAIGGAVAGGLAGLFSLTMPAPAAAVLGLMVSDNPLLYAVCVLAGSFVCAACVILFKRFIRFDTKNVAEVAS